MLSYLELFKIQYAKENLEPYDMDEVGTFRNEKPTEARAIMSIVHSDTIKPQVTKVILQCNATKDIENQEWMLPQMLQMEDPHFGDCKYCQKCKRSEIFTFIQFKEVFLREVPLFNTGGKTSVGCFQNTLFLGVHKSQITLRL